MYTDDGWPRAEVVAAIGSVAELIQAHYATLAKK